MTVEESLIQLNQLSVLSVDTETDGRDANINKLLCVQIGNKENQYVIDCSTVNIKEYKELLESKFCIFQNAKFDLQFFYSVGIIIRRLYDTMIVEQFLHLGYPSGVIPYNLAAIAERRLHKYIDKTVRGEIIWRGLDDKVIEYAANDVVDLEDIMKSQLVDLRDKECMLGAQLECEAIPGIAYCEWCGIKLDENKWKSKMQNDQTRLMETKSKLNDFCNNNPLLSKFTYINRQGDLFTGYDLTPKCKINWSSSRQVVEVAKILGFDTIVKDKKTGEDKDSVLEKTLKAQKGINDEFLELYFNYQEAAKVCSTYGQSQLNMINPLTGRCHTVYWQLGASSGRMSCGSQKPNTDLAKLKGIPPSECTYANFQQLPADDATRGSFVAEEGNVLCDCDYSSMESFLAADIYNDEDFKNEFLYGSKDTHSLFAWMVFRKECEELGCTCVADVKSKAPFYRKKVKAVEFNTRTPL